MVEQYPGSGELKGSICSDQVVSHEKRLHMEPLTAINAVVSAVSQALDLETILQTALSAVLGVVGVDAVAIGLVDESAGELVLQAQHGWQYGLTDTPLRASLAGSTWNTVVQGKARLIYSDLSLESDVQIPELVDARVVSLALVPMHARGRVVGVLMVAGQMPHHFIDDEVMVLCTIADQVGLALDNAHLYEYSKEQSSRLSAILHSSADAIIATNNYGHISLVNPSAEQLFNFRASEVVGLPLSHVPLPSQLREGLQRAMRSNGVHGKTVFEVTLPNGRTFSANISPVYSHKRLQSTHKAEGWVVVVQNVTHLRHAELLRSDFIHAAAHDLRNPLGVTLGALAMLESDISDISDMYREVISIGIQGINRMQNMLESWVDLEDIDSGIALKQDEIDIRDLVEWCSIEMQQPFQKRDQTLRLDVPEQLPAIRGDMHWLRRALLNLLKNANRYTPDGGSILLHTYVQDDELYIEVNDNGPGIPPEAQPHLFDRFFSYSLDKHKTKGAGLGLAIVKSVAERHGGRVFVQSEPKKGSTFGIALPVA